MPTEDPKAPVPAPLDKSAVADEGSVATAEVDATAEGGDEAVDDGQEVTSEASAEETSTAEISDDEGESESDDAGLEEFLGDEPKEHKKDNVQRRIDQLTAQLKELKAQNAQLQQAKTPDKTPEYTDAQLKSALKKALDEGDSELAWEVMEYKNEKTKRDLIKAYEQEKAQATSVINDWQKVTNDYSRVWQDDGGKEIYPGARQELNLMSEGSALYKLALKLYHTTDEDGMPRYAGPGAQRQAVAEALAMILRKRGAGAGDKKKLERALAKEKRKKSLATGGAMKPEKSMPKRPMNEQERLADYLEERRKFRNERT